MQHEEIAIPGDNEPRLGENGALKNQIVVRIAADPSECAWQHDV
jgi:hypothetical protein